MNILILDDNAALLKRLSENISGFNVFTAQTIDAAKDILKVEDISIIAVDYDLGHAKTGDMLSDILFESGKSIPSMLFSGKDLSSGTQKFLDKKGFSKIISKVDADGTVSELIEESAKQILSDCTKRVYDVKKRVEMIGNGEYPLKFGDEVKTIQEWIETLANCECENNEKQIKELIIAHCLALVKRKSNPDFIDLE
jgi:response regulator RpfG family c-di-GMP phosphodiesterase